MLYIPCVLTSFYLHHAFAVEDELRVPRELPAGDYVLGWRWDAEMTSQVWSTCADITKARKYLQWEPKASRRLRCQHAPRGRPAPAPWRLA